MKIVPLHWMHSCLHVLAALQNKHAWSALWWLDSSIELAAYGGVAAGGMHNCCECVCPVTHDAHMHVGGDIQMHATFPFFSACSHTSLMCAFAKMPASIDARHILTCSNDATIQNLILIATCILSDADARSQRCLHWFVKCSPAHLRDTLALSQPQSYFGPHPKALQHSITTPKAGIHLVWTSWLVFYQKCRSMLGWDRWNISSVSRQHPGPMLWICKSNQL